MFQKCDVQDMKCFRNVTFKIWNVSKMLHAKYELFQKCDVQNMKFFKNVTFKTWNVSKTSRFWNIVWTLNTLFVVSGHIFWKIRQYLRKLQFKKPNYGNLEFTIKNDFMNILHIFNIKGIVNFQGFRNVHFFSPGK